MATVVSPKVAALDRLAAARARFEESELMHRVLGNVPEANGAHQYVLWCIRAQIAEREDRTPAGLDRRYSGDRG